MPAVAKMPNQVLRFMPLMLSSRLGTSGRAGSGDRQVTPIALSLPARVGQGRGDVVDIRSAVPSSSADSAGLAPPNGKCCSSTWVSDWNHWPAIWPMLPLPAEA